MSSAYNLYRIFKKAEIIKNLCLSESHIVTKLIKFLLTQQLPKLRDSIGQSGESLSLFIFLVLLPWLLWPIASACVKFVVCWFVKCFSNFCKLLLINTRYKLSRPFKRICECHGWFTTISLYKLTSQHTQLWLTSTENIYEFSVKTIECTYNNVASVWGAEVQSWDRSFLKIIALLFFIITAPVWKDSWYWWWWILWWMDVCQEQETIQ